MSIYIELYSSYNVKAFEFSFGHVSSQVRVIYVIVIGLHEQTWHWCTHAVHQNYAEPFDA